MFGSPLAWIRLVILVTGVALVATAGPVNADSKRAAEFFALAQAAEKRSDWQVAIRNYERAYDESPHPDILFNIANAYERLNRLRDAARYLTRFSKDTGSEDERARANAKLAELRSKPAQVSFSSDPPGAVVMLDDVEIGETPLTLPVDAGEHKAMAIAGEQKSRARKLIVEFGEPVSIDFRIGAKPGQLTINSNIAEAEVVIDGVPRGRVPFSAKLPAGKHTVLVSAPGYQTVARDVEVPSEGSEQITAQLTAILGAGGVKPPAPVKRGSIGVLIGFGLGLSSEADGDGSARGIIEGGIRTRSQQWDLTAMYGSYGGRVGVGYGVATRLYFRGGLLRPYARAALAYGRVDDFAEQSTGSFAGEGGIGLRYVGKPGGRRSTSISFEYFAEVNFQIASANTEETPIDSGTGQSPLQVSPIGLVSLSFPVTIGIAMRFGSR